MGNDLNLSGSASSSVANTANPQSTNSSGFQGISSSSLQSPGGSSTLNNSANNTNSIALKNFNINTLSLSTKPEGSVTGLSQTGSTNGLSSTAIIVICAAVIASILALYLANKTNQAIKYR